MYDIPRHAKDALDRYVNQRIRPGGFLEAVLINNLFLAVGRADSENIKALKDITMYVYNEIPSICWGSKEIYNEWLSEKVTEKLTRSE